MFGHCYFFPVDIYIHANKEKEGTKLYLQKIFRDLPRPFYNSTVLTKKVSCHLIYVSVYLDWGWYFLIKCWIFKNFSTFLIFFLFLGDEIPKQDVLSLLNELAPKEDEEGFIPYMPFLEKLCGKK